MRIFYIPISIQLKQNSPLLVLKRAILYIISLNIKGPSLEKKLLLSLAALFLQARRNLVSAIVVKQSYTSVNRLLFKRPSIIAIESLLIIVPVSLEKWEIKLIYRNVKVASLAQIEVYYIIIYSCVKIYSSGIRKTNIGGI